MRKNKLIALVAALLIPVCATAEGVGTFSGGTGTEADPYLITKVADLLEIQNYLHSGQSTYEGCYFMVGNDITFSGESGLKTGLSALPFMGNFDGNGKKFYGVCDTVASNVNSFAVFSYLGSKGVVKNLTIASPLLYAQGSLLYSSFLVANNQGVVENCHVTNATMYLSNANQNNLNAGLVAYNLGTVKDCSFSGTVYSGCAFGSITGSTQGGMVDSCTSSADITITRSNTYTGGITSYANNQSNASYNIKDCAFTGYIHIVKGGIVNTYVGGISGYNSGAIITGCFNRGKIVALNHAGGIAGLATSGTTISNCYNSGLISDIFMDHDSTSVTYGMLSNQGGIVGYGMKGTVEQCFNTGTIRSFKAAGGIAGAAEDFTISNSYNAGAIDAPYISISGSTYMQYAGGIVGNQSSAQFVTKLTNCLSLGTINAASAARPAQGAYVGHYTSDERISLTNCHYDSQVAGWGSDETGPLSTSELTAGTALSGYDASVWDFTSGLYPRLKSSMATDAALAGAAPVMLASADVHTAVKSNVTLGTGSGATWSVTGDGASLGSNAITITRSSAVQQFTATSTVGTATRQNMMKIYPDMFTGSGTEADPYIIDSYDDMKELASVTTQGGLDFKGQYVALGADIDMQSDDSFACIGLNPAYPFAGTFDGAGHSLKNWKLSNQTNQVRESGLFGNIATTGMVKNLTIDATCSVGLYLNSGVIAGRVFGAIADVKVLPATLLSRAAGGTWGGIAYQVESTGSITDCYVGSNITLSGASNRVAGIACVNNGTITGCQYAGSLTGTAASNLACIACTNSGTIDNCLASGNVTAQSNVGGIVASNMATGVVSNSLATGVVNYTSNVDAAGAVAGVNAGKFSNVVYDSQITILNNIKASGIEGRLTREIIAGTYGDRWTANGTTYPQLTKFASLDAAMITSFPIIFADTENRREMTEDVKATCYNATGLTWKLDDGDDFSLPTTTKVLTFDGGNAFCDDKVIERYAGITRQIPISAYGNILSGSGTEADPWIIATKSDLTKLAKQSALAANHGDYAGKHFKFTADIAMTTAIPGIACGGAKKFNGVLHGDGHTVTGIDISTTAEATGLVGYLGEEGKIENLNVASGTVTATQCYTGGIVGRCAGTVVNCTNGTTVTGAQYYTGGVIGYAEDAARLDSLTNTGTVTSTNFYTGGVAGYLAGKGTAPYSHMVNRGAVSGTMYVGGVIGFALTDTLSHLTNYGTVSPSKTSTCNMHGGIIGVADACRLICNARNYGTVSGGVTGLGGVIGRYWPVSNATDTLTVADCLNAGAITGKTASSTSNLGGIVGMSDNYSLIVERCANTAAITNPATKVSASTAAAGGIVGGGSPTITSCFNSGVISGLNCIGGILGRINGNNPATLTDCINTGWLEGYNSTSANVGSISGYYNAATTYSGCVYDKQMSNIAAVGKADRTGAEGRLTSEIVNASATSAAGYNAPATAACYPVPASLASDTAVMVASVPIFLDEGDTRYLVTHDFDLGALDGLVWTAGEPIVIDGTRARITSSYDGTDTVTATLGSVSRSIPLAISYVYTGITTPSMSKGRIVTGRYNLQGQPVDADYRGVVILRYSDGSAIKQLQH